MFRHGQWVRVKSTGETGTIQKRRDAMLNVKRDDIDGWNRAHLVDRGPPFLVDQRGRYAVEMNRIGRGWVFYWPSEIEPCEPPRVLNRPPTRSG